MEVGKGEESLGFLVMGVVESQCSPLKVWFRWLWVAIEVEIRGRKGEERACRKAVVVMVVALVEE